jgi:hypothetical protein
VDKLGDVTTEMTACLGDDVIEVQVFTRRPDPVDAKALLWQLYDSFEKSGA